MDGANTAKNRNLDGHHEVGTTAGPNAEPEEPATPSTSTVSITLNPAVRQARVSVDRRRLKGPPFAVTFPRDRQKHTITIASPGYRLWRQEITFDRDREITADLERRLRGSHQPTSGSPPEDEDPWGDD